MYYGMNKWHDVAKSWERARLTGGNELQKSRRHRSRGCQILLRIIPQHLVYSIYSYIVILYCFFFFFLAHLNAVTRIYSRSTSSYFSHYWYLTLKLSIFNSGILNQIISWDKENDTPHVPRKIYLNSFSSRLFPNPLTAKQNNCIEPHVLQYDAFFKLLSFLSRSSINLKLYYILFTS